MNVPEFIKALRALYAPDGDACAPESQAQKTPLAGGANGDTSMFETVSQNVVGRNGTLLDGVVEKRDHDGQIYSLIHALMARCDSQGLVAIAPGVAQRIVEETNFHGQRRRKPARVAERLLAIRNGHWSPGVSTISFAETPDGALYLVDGQHRLWAIYESGRVCKTRVAIIPAANMDDVRRVYALFDLPDAKRGDGEMLASLCLDEKLALRRDTVRALYKALTIIRNGMEPASNASRADAMSRTGRLEDISAWRSEAEAYETLIRNADAHIANRMLRGGCMAVALVCLRHQPAKARAFFGGVAANDGLRKNDPRARLVADFSSRNLSQGSMRQSVQRVAAAWNAFYDGRELSMIKCIEGAALVIKGTPYNGKGGAK